MNFENFNKSDKIKWIFIIIAFVAEAICIVINFNQLNKLKENNAAVAKYHAAVENLKDETVKSIPFTGIPMTVDANVEQAKKVAGSTEFILEYYESSGNDEAISVDVSDIIKFASTGDSQIAANKAEYQRKLEEERAKQRSANIAAEMQRRGNIGRLICPSVGIDVALFASNSQAVADAADSACYFGKGGSMVIGDHWNQGFTRIKSLSPGSQIYIDRGTSKSYYTVTSRFTATNTGYDIVDGSGASVLGRASLVLYTCNGADWHNITVVLAS